MRELANVMEHSVILSDGQAITPDDLPESLARSSRTAARNPTSPVFDDQPRTLREMEDQMILHVLDRHDSDKPAAAKELGIALKTLYNRLSQLEIKRQAG